VCGIIKIDVSTSIDGGRKHMRESVLELDEKVKGESVEICPSIVTKCKKNRKNEKMSEDQPFVSGCEKRRPYKAG
jgi:hypothetical protein